MNRADVLKAWADFCEADLENRVVISASAIMTLEQEREFSVKAVDWWAEALSATDGESDRAEFSRILDYYRQREVEFETAIKFLEENGHHG